MGLTLILAKVLILIISLKYYNEAYDWLERRLQAKLKDSTVTAFRSTSTILFTMINTATVYLDVWYFTVSEHTSFIGWYLPGTILVFILVPATVCFQIHRNPCSWTLWERVGHWFIAVQFLWFINRLFMDVIISVFFFIIAPAQTLGIVTLLLCTIGCYLILLVNFYTAWKERLPCNMFKTYTIGLLVLLSVTSVTLLYIALVDNGLQSSGLGGFILSLIPSVVAILIGFYVNKENFHNFFFKKQKSYEDNREESERKEPKAQTGATNQRDTHDNTGKEATQQSEHTPLLLSQPQINI